jgi:serine/threonine protein kinase
MPNEAESESFPSARFAWEQTLGSGGFSHVFLCRDKQSGGLVVVKTPRPLPPEQAVLNWFQDADVLERVRHELFPRSIERGFVDPHQKERPFHVLEYFDGISLYEFVRRYGAMTPTMALPVFRILLEGLQSLHQQGFTHCDVTPANVLLRCDQLGWRLKLIDFGTARPVACAPENGLAVPPLLTPGYAAPEMLEPQSLRVGPPADVYSFGCTACFSLTGTSPGANFSWERISASIASLIVPCLADDPTSRPTIETLLQKIDRLTCPPPPEIAAVAAAQSLAPTTVATDNPSKIVPPAPLTAVHGPTMPRTGSVAAAVPQSDFSEPPGSPPLTVVAAPASGTDNSRTTASEYPSQPPGSPPLPYATPDPAAAKPSDGLLDTLRRSIGRWIHPSEPKGSGWARTSREATDAEQFEVTADEVDCTVFAPPRIDRGSSALIQVFLHLPERSNAVAALASQFDSDAAARGTAGLTAEVTRGAVVMIELDASGLEVGCPTQTLVWRGRPASATFEARVPLKLAVNLVIATVRISIEGVPCGQVKFKTTIGPAPAGAECPVVHRWCRYQRAFISYCSSDRDEVLKRVQMLKRLHVEFFQDVLDIEPGAEWQPLLYRRIDECDVFLLFWSSAAGASEWVRKEFLYALDRKARDAEHLPELIPVILEGPPIPPPPPELKHLHFNDQILNFVSNRYSASA